MQKIVFTEEYCRPEILYPFTLTRRIQDIQVGILSIREKWEKMLGLPSFDKKENDYKDHPESILLNKKMEDDIYLLIPGNLLPTTGLVRAIKKLKNGESLMIQNANSLVTRFSKNEIDKKSNIIISKNVDFSEEIISINHPWEIFQFNDKAIRRDFELLTKRRKSQTISKTNKTINPSQIFIEKGAKVEHCILNAGDGPIYIGANSLIMEGSLVRGPFSIGRDSVVKMGAKIYAATSVGDSCVVGGEIKNTVFFSHTNKAHDGYIGDSVIGSHCNLGAGTSNSNVKNNASIVKVWTTQGSVEVGLKCGVFMGDYSKTAINTSINTGSVIGVCTNVFGNGLTEKHIPSFSWGNKGKQHYKFDKALTDISNWKRLKGIDLNDREKRILKYIFEHYKK
jgi:UDP-N-acetylglucosamine diphosphorylase / glucose-1-phosphate thymidylyltransferase / UDP-N-acetylgalactosamine diphosphorylase / glucosamine-1-phosphate N-acetyltransferase / galactosamine-1-phosphate N-acetyltransferase